VERQPVAVARFAEQQRRLSDQVERKVGQADIDLEHWPMPAPFAEPLPKHQSVVAEAQENFGA
jgi:hypothetical protein